MILSLFASLPITASAATEIVITADNTALPFTIKNGTYGYYGQTAQFYDSGTQDLVFTGNFPAGVYIMVFDDCRLILRNATFQGPSVGGSTLSVYSDVEMTLEGVNSVVGRASPTGNAIAAINVDSGNFLTIEGTGSLEVKGSSGSSDINDIAIHTGTVIVNGGNVTMMGRGFGNGDLIVNGGTVAVQGKAPPSVAAVSPDEGPVTGGTAVILTGANLDTVTSVRIDGAAVTNLLASANSITCTVPAGASIGGAADISVVSNTTGAQLLPGGFTYTDIAAPLTAVQGGGTVVPYGGSLVLAVTNTGEYPGPSYEWFQNGTAVGMDSPSLTVTEGGSYTVKVTTGGWTRESAALMLTGQHRVTASAGAGGSITPDGNVDVNEGADQSFAVTADKGYKIADVLVDGVSVGPVSRPVLKAVSADQTIEAAFIYVGTGGSGGTAYTVSFDARGGSAVSGELVKKGDAATLPAAPKREGYRFTGWYTDSACTNRYDFSKGVTGSLTLYAGWAEILSPYIGGYPDGTFQPNGKITRAQAAQMLYECKGSGMTTAAMSDMRGANFTDMEKGSWYYDAVTTLTTAGLFSGYPDGTFRPEAEITRAEFTTMLVRYMVLETSGTSSFPDVAADHWAAGCIAAAQTAGLVDGYPDGRFGPQDAMTRAQAVTVLNRMLDRKTDEALFMGMEMPFRDVSHNHWAFWQIMAAAVEHEAGMS